MLNCGRQDTDHSPFMLYTVEDRPLPLHVKLWKTGHRPLPLHVITVKDRPLPLHVKLWKTGHRPLPLHVEDRPLPHVKLWKTDHSPFMLNCGRQTTPPLCYTVEDRPLPLHAMWKTNHSPFMLNCGRQTTPPSCYTVESPFMLYCGRRTTPLHAAYRSTPPPCYTNETQATPSLNNIPEKFLSLHLVQFCGDVGLRPLDTRNDNCNSIIVMNVMQVTLDRLCRYLYKKNCTIYSRAL